MQRADEQYVDSRCRRQVRHRQRWHEPLLCCRRAVTLATSISAAAVAATIAGFTHTTATDPTRAQSTAHAGADQPSRLLLALVPYRLPVHPWE